MSGWTEASYSLHNAALDRQEKHLGFTIVCVRQQAASIHRAVSKRSPFTDAVEVLNYTLGVQLHQFTACSQGCITLPVLAGDVWILSGLSKSKKCFTCGKTVPWITTYLQLWIWWCLWHLVTHKLQVTLSHKVHSSMEEKTFTRRFTVQRKFCIAEPAGCRSESEDADSGRLSSSFFSKAYFWTILRKIIHNC